MGKTEIKKGTQIATKGTKGPSLSCFGRALWLGTLCVVGQLLPAALGLGLGYGLRLMIGFGNWPSLSSRSRIFASNIATAVYF